MGDWQTAGRRRRWSDKGSGAKGKPAGSASNGPTDKKGFFCEWDGCRAAMMHQETWAGRDCCHVCERPKGTALNPPTHLIMDWAFEERKERMVKKSIAANGGANPNGNKNGDKHGDLTEEQKQLRDSRVMQLKNLSDKDVAPSKAPDAPAAMDTSEQALAPSKDQVQRRKIIGVYVSPTPPGGDSLYPSPGQKTLKTPATVVAEALAGKSAQAYDDQAEKVVLLKYQLTVFRDMAGTEAVVKDWESKLKTAEAALDRLAKKEALSAADPASAAAAANAKSESVSLARQVEVTRQADLVGQYSKLAALRVSKHVDDLQFCDEMITLAQDRRAELVAVFTTTQEEWAKIDEARAVQEQEILSLFDHKIATVRQALAAISAAPPLLGAPAVAVVVQTGGPILQAPGPVVDGGAVDVDGDAATEAEQQAAEDYELVDDSNTTVDKLPDLTDKLEDDQKAYVENLWNILKQVFSCSDLPMMPFSALQITPLFAKQLLGDNMWRGFYGSTRVVLEHDVVPRRMMGAMDVALKRIGAQHVELVRNFLKDDDKVTAAVDTIRSWKQKEKAKEEKTKKARKTLLGKTLLKK